MRRRKVLTVILTIACMILSGCEHKHLCYDHTHGLPVRINVNWENFQEETPTGMTVMAYPKNGGAPVEKSSNNIDYVDIRLAEGDYDILLYNQSPYEFGYLKFTGFERYETAAVTIVEHTKSWYDPGEQEIVAEEPEWFASGSMEEFSVTEEMIVQYAHPDTKYGEVKSFECDTIFPRTRVYTVNIALHVAGMKNLYSVRGTLDGMAEGCKIATGEPLERQVTHLLESWSLERGANVDDGTLYATLKCFGLPAGHLSKKDENHLKLSILLVDLKTVIDVEFMVGSRFEVNTELDLSLDLEVGTDADGGPVDLPDVEPADGTGGFDVDVGDWGDPEIIEIVM